jgi:hypothetical protein
MTTARTSRANLVPEYDTVAVSAMPHGWQNVFEQDGGGYWVEPCPAVLIQEHRTSYDVESPHRAHHMTAPYETRVVFATLDYTERGLMPAEETDGYLGTIGPSTEAQSWFERRSQRGDVSREAYHDTSPRAGRDASSAAAGDTSHDPGADAYPREDV